MSTYAELVTRVSRDLRDEGQTTFTEEVVKDMITAAFAEIGRIAPRRFTEDLDPIADTTSYALLVDDFPDGDSRIEVRNVEVLDNSGTRARAIHQVPAQHEHPTGLTYSQAGWLNWDGTLYLPDRTVDFLDPDVHLIRVYGYAPYPLLSADDDAVPFNPELVEIVVLICVVESLRRLINDRVLFKQWQTRTNNTSTTQAGLMTDLNIAMEELRRKERAVTVLRDF